MDKLKRQTKRAAVGTIGGLLLLVGIVAIPYPGPGWLIVFLALGILATEFDWAQRVLDFTKGKYDAWQNWLKKQPVYIKAIFWTLALIVVTLTVWLLNGYGLINEWLGLGQDWVRSPLFK
jgi:uncharacterized protein (TIGR02611 family)